MTKNISSSKALDLTPVEGHEVTVSLNAKGHATVRCTCSPYGPIFTQKAGDMGIANMQAAGHLAKFRAA